MVWIDKHKKIHGEVERDNEKKKIRTFRKGGGKLESKAKVRLRKEKEDKEKKRGKCGIQGKV